MSLRQHEIYKCKIRLRDSVKEGAKLLEGKELFLYAGWQFEPEETCAGELLCSHTTRKTLRHFQDVDCLGLPPGIWS